MGISKSEITNQWSLECDSCSHMHVADVFFFWAVKHVADVNAMVLLV